MAFSSFYFEQNVEKLIKNKIYLIQYYIYLVNGRSYQNFIFKKRIDKKKDDRIIREKNNNEINKLLKDKKKELPDF